MPASEPVIQTRGLSKAYGDVRALRDLNLDVPRHSIVGFLGPNGAGKSTTIKLLLGLIRPTAGSASVFGLDIVRDSTAIRRRVGYLPQHPSFYPDLSARETLRFVARFFYSLHYALAPGEYRRGRRPGRAATHHRAAAGGGNGHFDHSGRLGGRLGFRAR